MYVFESKANNLNIATLVVPPASISAKIDHQNIAPGGDLAPLSGDIDPQVLP